MTVALDPVTELFGRVVAIHQERDAQAARLTRRYYMDPVAFAHDCVDWGEDGPAPYQEETWAAIPEHKRVAVRSLHGVGKSTTAAIAVLWFAITRDAAGVDWKCPTTAGVWRQLEQYLWPEVHKWARQLRWDKIGRDPFHRGELLTLNLHLRYGSAFSVASNVPAYIEGVHADSVLYLFDEAKSILTATFDAAEGAFTGAGGTEAFALALSTPGDPVGRFYDVHAHKPGLEDWHTIHVTLDQAIAAGRVSAEWAEQRKRQWGAQSALYANRVLGEFHSADEDAVIPLSWLQMAVERWKANAARPLAPLSAVGVDVAWEGDDRTVIAPRHGNRITELRVSFHEPTDMTAGRVAGILDSHAVAHAPAIVDCDGLGVGTYDNLRSSGKTAFAYHGGGSTELKDRTGELGFANVRAAAWWKLREALDPEHDPLLELPDDNDLLSDLCAPRWSIDKRGNILIEPKVEVKKRLGRSPDAGDAVVMGCWVPAPPKRKGPRMVAAGRLPR